jgi:hypothetical protein
MRTFSTFHRYSWTGLFIASSFHNFRFPAFLHTKITYYGYALRYIAKQPSKIQ